MAENVHSYNMTVSSFVTMMHLNALEKEIQKQWQERTHMDSAPHPPNSELHHDEEKNKHIHTVKMTNNNNNGQFMVLKLR